MDSRKGYYSEDIAGTFGVPLEEHQRQTQVSAEHGYINVPMLTGDQKPTTAGHQLALPSISQPDAVSTGEEHPDELSEV